MKIDEMANVFLNLADFAQHAFFTLTPPSSNLCTKKGNVGLKSATYKQEGGFKSGAATVS